MNEFVTKEIAEKLNKIMYNVHCSTFYVIENFTAECIDDNGDVYEVDFEEDELYLNYPIKYQNYKDKCIPAFKIDDVLRWLRNYKNIFILPHFDQIESKWFVYVSEQNLPQDFPIYVSKLFFETYEEAALHGIEYFINENLKN